MLILTLFLVLTIVRKAGWETSDVIKQTAIKTRVSIRFPSRYWPLRSYIDANFAG